MKTRVLMTTTAYPPSTGGVQGYLADLRSHLQRFEADVVTLWLSNRNDWLRGTTIRLATTGNAELSPGVRSLGWTRSTRARMAPWAMAYYAIVPLAARRIAALMVPELDRMVGADHRLIHNHRIGREFLALASLTIARRRGLPFVLTPYHHPRWRGYRYTPWIDVYRSADALFALTRAERDELAALGVAPEKIHVIGGGVEPAPPADGDRFRRSIRSERPIVLYLGQLYEYKGYVRLVAAADLLHRRGLEFELVFLGPATAESRRFFARSDRPWVHVLGRVDDQTKWDAIDAARLVCLPSSQESFGRVFLEAWAMGRPVIGGRIPAVSEIISDGRDGLLVDPSSVEELARALDRLLTDGELATRMGEAGKGEIAGRFTWSEVARRVEGVYQALLGAGPVSRS